MSRDCARPAELDLWRTFAAVAAAVPDRVAVVHGDRRTTYGELAARARRLARFLSARGLGSRVPRAELEPWEAGQDAIGLYLLNGLPYLELSLAAYGSRTVHANINYRYVEDELRYLLDDSRARVVFQHGRFSPVLAGALDGLDEQPLVVHVDDGSGAPPLAGAISYEDALREGGDGEVEPLGGTHQPDDLYVLYTGGTTGLPKATLWRQADVYEAALGGDVRPGTLEDVAAAAAASNPKVVLPIAPFMHGAAHWAAMRALLAGDTVVVNSVVDRLDPSDVWSLVERERVTNVLMVGEAFARPLLDELDGGIYDTRSVEIVVIGGAATSPQTKHRMMALLPSAIVADVAGASETGSLLSAVSAKGVTTAAGVFKPGPSTVVLDEAKTRCLSAGEDAVGWVAKSGRIPLGYLGDRTKTEATFPTVDGVRYVVPGDRARLRADGLIELLGRDSVTINSGGEKIFAEEVEAALLRLPEVRDVVVVGRPSERWGEEVVAVVALHHGVGASDDELVQSIQGIASYKRPKAVVHVDHIVRSPAGKADYRWAKGIVTGGTG